MNIFLIRVEGYVLVEGYGWYFWEDITGCTRVNSAPSLAQATPHSLHPSPRHDYWPPTWIAVLSCFERHRAPGLRSRGEPGYRASIWANAIGRAETAWVGRGTSNRGPRNRDGFDPRRRSVHVRCPRPNSAR